MRRASRESFPPPISSLDPQDSHQDANIGDHDDEATEHSYCSSQGEKHQLIDLGVCTRKGRVVKYHRKSD